MLNVVCGALWRPCASTELSSRRVVSTAIKFYRQLIPEVVEAIAI